MKLFILSLLFVIIFITATRRHENESSYLHIWNIGQGQWLTYEAYDQCEHYDLGGEKAPWNQILQACKNKKNILFISHWDWDHMSFAEQFYRKVSNTCLSELPDGPASTHKKKILERIPICETSTKVSAKIFWPGDLRDKAKNNGRSNIIISNGFLVPGDSPTQQEKKWAPKLPTHGIQNLILGHHGSRTSTSELLLMNARRLHHAIASSRQKKYGHPHAEVVARLRRFRIPLLVTEEWGNLHFRINEDSN